MLFPTIFSPTIFSDIPEDEQARKAVCSNTINLLQDLAENCLILVDSDKYISQKLIENLNKFPVKYRIDAKKIIKFLRTNNRLILIDKESYNLPSHCQELSCQHSLGIASKIYPPAIFMTENCCECIKKQDLNIKKQVIDTCDYPLSNFSSLRSGHRNITLTNGEWNQEQFEDKILIPILKYAKHIKIFDRMIGRAINYSYNHKKFPHNYEQTIIWILDLFNQYSDKNKPRIFSIHTGVNIDFLDDITVEEAKNILREFESEIKAKYNFEIELILKEETGNEETLPHDRYLITDQFAIAIGRGFDLLWSDKQMKDAGLDPNRDARPVRDVTISCVSDVGKIEKTVRKLPDL